MGIDRIHVKVCGITRLEDAERAAELGASALGFVFWPASPRFIDPYRAQAIVRVLPPFVTPVGVFVDQPAEFVEEVASLVRLGAVQLHGDESVEYCAQMRNRVIKAVGLKARHAGPVSAYPSQVLILLDVHDPVRRGGTGRTVDWETARRIAASRRTILSGGLRPENVAAAIDAVRPYGVDVSSGVESSPGVKDRARLEEFLAAVRPCGAGVV
jgi:phosphoribosylanthranilate isomerase